MAIGDVYLTRNIETAGSSVWRNVNSHRIRMCRYLAYDIYAIPFLTREQVRPFSKAGVAQQLPCSVPETIHHWIVRTLTIVRIFPIVIDN